MDPVTHRRMRTAHLNHGETCTCGRKVYGNGRLSHLRTCDAHLAAVGWPLDAGWRNAIYTGYDGDVRPIARVVREVERRLGAFYLERRKGGDRIALRDAEMRDRVWQYVNEIDRELSTR